MAAVLADNRLSDEAKCALSDMGFKVISLPAAEELRPSPLASHADIVIFRHKKTVITSKHYFEANRALFDALRADYKATVLCDQGHRGADYPFDAALNALVIGNRIFCKTDTVSPLIIEYAKDAGLEIIHTKQGYPACTTLTISDNAAITADEGMSKVLKKCGIRTYVISNSEKILLPPYEYGFIGGCGGAYGASLYFTGDIDSHPDAQAIKAAIREQGLEPTSLTSGALVDLGGLLFFE